MFKKLFWIVLLVSVLAFFSSAAHSVSIITFCNETGNELRVASAREHYYQGRDVWLESGWKVISNNNCERIFWIGSNYWSAFAFMSIINGKKTFPYFNVENSYPPPFSSEHICVNLNKENFSYPKKEKNEVGRNCPADAHPLRLSFFVRGGSNDVKLTLR